MATQKYNVGTTGRRRIVPVLGIDYIAGQFETKTRVVERQGYPYGVRPASIGGRTRKWSQINFLHIRPSNPPSAIGADQLERIEQFTIAAQSANLTVKSLPVIQQVMLDFSTGVTRQDVNPTKYATLRGWVTAVRYAQLEAGQEITPTTTTWSW